MKNDVVRWTQSACPHVDSPTTGNSCNSGGSSARPKHHKSPPRSGRPSMHSSSPLTTSSSPSSSSTMSSSSSASSWSSLTSSSSASADRELSNKCDSERHDRSYCTALSGNSRGRSRAFVLKRRTDFTRLLGVCLQICIVLCLCSANVGVVADDSELEANPSTPGGHFTHTWAVHVPNGDEGGLADQVARDHGFINLGKIFDDHYHFAHNKVSKRSLEPAHHHQKRLEDDDRVHWAKQQTAKRRQKRDFIRMRPSRTSTRSSSLVDSVQFSDPKWPQMWYLNRGGGLDMNVIPAWKEGITGKGVVVTILDDGLESDHPDIEANYDPNASYDVNGHDPDPMPHYDMTDSNRHGTRCAGEVAATANNSICAVGIAYGASVGGVRMLDGDVTDAVEARSLSLNPQHIDIYSASWGPDDDGKTVDGPGELASRAFIEGVTKGRSGKGSIFIWASGNGGRELDNCNCDGYTNSIWTLSISSATEDGRVPWYSEKCSSTLATTYSSGDQSEKQVVTTDLHHSCTVSHTGTSASAPLAAGIAALVLESNQNLTWRDLQHIVVRTAKPANLKDTTWSKNGVGRRISHSFGYGLMDAAAMVQLARTWKTVPEQQRCEINAPHVDKIIPARGSITLQLTVKHCLSVNYLEHVQAKITLTSIRRGDIQLYLKSPAGTKVTLLTSRIHDVSRSGFNQWPFMSVHTWGESPHGNWQLEIHNEGRYMGHAFLREWSLIFYGTTHPIDPSDPVSTRTNPSEDTTTLSSSVQSSSSSWSSSSSSSSSTTTNLHQVYSPQYPRMPPSNFNSFSTQGGKLSAKIGSTKGATNATASMAAGGSKKQQQQPPYHQVSATYGVILGSAKNKSKNGKSGSGSNGSGGGSGGKNKGSKSSNRPGNLQQQQSSQTSKSNFYRIPTTNRKSATSPKQQQSGGGGGGAGSSSGGASASAGGGSGGGGPTQRPKMSQQANYNANLGTAAGIGSSKSAAEKAGQSVGQSMAAGKLPIKAPKQVKDSNAYTGSTASSKSTPSQSTSSSSSSSSLSSLSLAEKTNHRIPKLFEHYEKIQQIYPEFHPYMGTGTGGASPGPKDATSSLPSISSSGGLLPSASISSPSSASSSSISSLSSSLSSSARQGPNRKQFQFYDPSVGAGSSSSSGSSSSRQSSSANSRGSTSSSSTSVTNPKPSRENSKKSSPSASGYHQQQQQQLTQKQLSSQLAKPPPPPRTVTQRPGERMYIPNRKSTNAQITQWDLIFYGTEAPAQPDDHVQISPGQFGTSFGGDMEHNLLEYDPDTASGQWRNVQQVGESLADVQHANDQTSTACLRVTLDQRCIVCSETTYLFNGRCYTSCPDKTFAVTEELNSTERNTSAALTDPNEADHLSNILSSSDEPETADQTRQKLCAACDKSCFQCSGTSPGHCTACYPGSQLRVISDQESYCYVFAERSSGNNRDENTESSGSWRTLPAIFLLIFVPSMMIIVIIVIAMITGKRLGFRRDYTYDRVAFDTANEETCALTEADDADTDADVDADTLESDDDRMNREQLFIPNGEQLTPRRGMIDESSSESEDVKF